jgi:Concanavalin A-like lectin/glucanases superfamily
MVKGLTTFVVFQRTQACAYSRVYDCGNNLADNNIVMMWEAITDTLTPTMLNANVETRFSTPITSAASWMVFCGVYNKTASTYTVYVNNVVVSCANSINTPIFQSRTTSRNYIGKSNWPADAYADMNLAELMIIDTCMTTTEITAMNTLLQTKWGI